jgi:bifunctional DNA-binding transcriptional regulator/antitoxin component of YhaV-PrlF toxin-antitoxin module
VRHLRGLKFALPFGKANSREVHMRRARLSSKSQITLPVDYRRRLGVEPGEELLMDFQDDRIVLLKNTGSALDELRALPPEIWAGAADEIQRARDEWDR